MQVYLVGGAVRDALLGLAVDEKDWVVVGSSAEELLQLGYSQVGKDFPVFLHPKSHEEYALARTERKTGPGHKGFSVDANVYVSLEEDLLRRDLSINAMAQDEHGALVDPYGGFDDLQARVLRHVSVAFAEDPLRVLRTARFYARFAGLGFSIAQKTQKLLREMCASGTLKQVSAERVWQELHKTLARPGAEKFFSVLQSCAGMQDWFSELGSIDTAKLGLVWNRIDADFSKMPDNASGADTLQWQKYAALGWFLLPDQSRSLSTRLKVPKKFQRGVMHLAEYGVLLSSWQTVSDEDLLEVVSSMGALRQSSDFEALLKVIGICGESDPDKLVQLCRALSRIGVADIQQIKKMSGTRLGEAIQRARLEYIHSHR